METISTGGADLQRLFRPPVLIKGQFAVVAAVDTSSRLPDAHPTAMAWVGNSQNPAKLRLIRPPTHWVEQGTADADGQTSYLLHDQPSNQCIDAAVVAHELQVIVQQHAVATLVPYVDRRQLEKLLSLRGHACSLSRDSALDIAAAIAKTVGLNDHDFTDAAADGWAASLKDDPVSRRVVAGARMIQATLDAAAAQGLLDPSVPIEIEAALPSSRKMSTVKRFDAPEMLPRKN